MFETAVVESKLHPIRKGRVATLPLSIAIHVFAISGVIASNVWSVDLPTSAPDQYERFTTASPAPVIPVEKPPVKVEPPQKSEPPKGPEPVFTEPPAQNPTVLTPTSVPPTIPVVEQGGGGLKEVAVGDPSLVGPGGNGPGTIDGGDTGPIQVGPGRATMPVVIKRVQPVYPRPLVTAGLRGSAVVECVVGRDGVIESARIVSATHQLFGQSARNAVLQWKFRPGRLGDQEVATIFHLTVNFDVVR